MAVLTALAAVILYQPLLWHVLVLASPYVVKILAVVVVLAQTAVAVAVVAIICMAGTPDLMCMCIT